MVKRLTVSIMVSLTAVAGIIGLARAANPDVLWNIVHGKCAVAVAPCLMVESVEHFALLKDINGIAQVLLIPTDKITGVEDPALLKADTPNFFADAWAHRDAMQAKLPHPIPRDAISLAVNAETARTQNQLHIHIDCLKPDAREALRAAAKVVDWTWGPLDIPVAGHHFTARRIDGENLSDFNPFRDVAQTLSDPASQMRRQNIVVVGAEFSGDPGQTVPGFLVLTDQAPAIPLGYGSGEDVQDHTCALAQ
jgi:CDP-diacylglycerol pyrophosphatase